MKTQTDVIKKHLGEHKWLRQIKDDDEGIHSFIHDYGWVIRGMYCTSVCKDREGGVMSAELSASGDLLRNKVK